MITRSQSGPIKQPPRSNSQIATPRIGGSESWMKVKETRVLELPEVSFGVVRDCFPGMTQEMPIAKERYLI